MSEGAFQDELKEAFIERFDGIENEFGEPNEDYEPDDQYWDDALHELADNAVPIWRADMYELFVELGAPELSDPGLIEGVTDVDKIVAIAIYDYAYNYLWELADEYGLNK